MNLRVLLIESEPEEVLFLLDALREIEEGRWLPEWPRIEPLSAATWEEAEGILSTASPHAILLDPDLADKQGAETFRRVQASVPDVPVILVMNSCDEALAVKLMREGAQDFLFKKLIDCAPLAHALRNAIMRHRLLAASRAAALMDSLTGLPNRAAFFASAGRDRHLADRLNRRWMLLIAEPKSLTEIAAAFGDQRRDLELVESAEYLRGVITPADMLARAGDSYFAIGVFDGEIETLEAAWLRIRNLAAEHRIEVGASIFGPDNPLGLDAMIEQALADLPGLKEVQPQTRSNLAGAA